MRALVAALALAAMTSAVSADVQTKEVQVKYNFTGGIKPEPRKERKPATPTVTPANSPFTPMVRQPRPTMVAVARPPMPAPVELSKPTYSGMEVVPFSTKLKPGTIIIRTSERRLYYVLPNGMAERYGIGVGREGFTWKGSKRITRKSEWPSWTPPARMIEREKAKGNILPAYMPGGPNNPLGARAMYLGGSLFRIHGTNQPSSIGTAVSSGCIRMLNEEVAALYGKVALGTLVIVE